MARPVVLPGATPGKRGPGATGEAGASVRVATDAGRSRFEQLFRTGLNN